MTYKELTDLVIADYQQINDDADITPAHALYWCIVAINDLRYKRGLMVPGMYRKQYVNVPVQNGTVTDPIVLQQGRKYVQLPSGFLVFDAPDAIEMVTYGLEMTGADNKPVFQTVTFSEVRTPNSVRRLGFNKHEEPSPSSPYFMRVGDKIMLIGVEKVKVRTVEMFVKEAISFSGITSLDEEVPLSNDLCLEVMRKVSAMSRFMLAIPKDLVNDGRYGAPQVNLPESVDQGNPTNSGAGQ